MDTTSPTDPYNRLRLSWVQSDQLRLVAKSTGTPAFIYSEARLTRNVARIKSAAAKAGLEDRIEIYIPFFPNSNPHVLKPLQALDVGLLLQIPSELEILTDFGFDKFIVSPGHVSRTELEHWADTGHPMFLSSLDEVSDLIDAVPHPAVYARLDSLGSGKPGIKYHQLQSLAQLLGSRGLELAGFELYCGSGNSVAQMVGTFEQAIMIYKNHFPTAKIINLAGGYEFSYTAWDDGEKHFAWEDYFDALREISDRHAVPSDVRFMFEPARDVLGDVGVLLLRVERNLLENEGARQVLTNGSRVLMPSAQYRHRRHNVIFLDQTMVELTADPIPAALRGRGILRHDYVLPGDDHPVPADVKAGDHALILDVGAYCATQHMEFLNIPPAAEVIVGEDGVSLISSAGGALDKWRHLLREKQSLQPR